MRFVDETVNTSKDDISLNESIDDKEGDKCSSNTEKSTEVVDKAKESTETEKATEGDAFDDMLKGATPEKKGGDDKADEKGSKENNVAEGGEKPTTGLKLASFSTMAQKSPGADGVEGGSQSRPS